MSTGCSHGSGGQWQTEGFSCPCVGHIQRSPDWDWDSGKTACPHNDWIIQLVTLCSFEILTLFVFTSVSTETPIETVERFAFYERAKKAFAVVATGCVFSLPLFEYYSWVFHSVSAIWSQKHVLLVKDTHPLQDKPLLRFICHLSFPFFFLEMRKP